MAGTRARLDRRHGDAVPSAVVLRRRPATDILARRADPQVPLDCWVYQELIHELRPQLIIETGTDLGGSALFLASICDLVGEGRVMSIDIRRAARVTHPRITFLVGDSTSPEILQQVRRAAAGTERVLVILDSDHHAPHVGRELRAYREFVTPGSYLVVEDTNVNGHPVMPEHGPGPHEAVHDFLREDSNFQIDKTREKFLMTYFPNGFLRRVASIPQPVSARRNDRPRGNRVGLRAPGRRSFRSPRRKRRSLGSRRHSRRRS